jgi:hypothetical protein
MDPLKQFLLLQLQVTSFNFPFLPDPSEDTVETTGCNWWVHRRGQRFRGHPLWQRLLCGLEQLVPGAPRRFVARTGDELRFRLWGLNPNVGQNMAKCMINPYGLFIKFILSW